MSLQSLAARRMDDWRAGVAHVTLNPNGPDAVRIHLVPPKPSAKNQPSLAILNGWYVIPLTSHEARLLRVFMEELTKQARHGKPISEEETLQILGAVKGRIKRFYPEVAEQRFEDDLVDMVNAFIQIAKGEKAENKFQRTLPMDQYAPHMPGPHRMDLIIAPMEIDSRWGCPLHCGICYAKGQRQMSVTKPLSTDEWKRTIDILWNEARVTQLTFTGGEPTTRKDLAELVRHAERFVTRLNTSGVTMTPGLSKSLYEASLDGVQVTLYSHEPQDHDALVGVSGAWERTVEGIKNAISAGLNVSINTPLCRLNYQAYPATLEFLHGLGIIYVSSSGLIVAGAAEKAMGSKETLTSEELYSVLKPAKDYSDANGMELIFTSPGWLSDEQLASLDLQPTLCGACLTNMAVAPNGTVVPCQSWLNDQGLGNILTTRWGKIWNNPQCKGIRARANFGNVCPLKSAQEDSQ
ncbi:MAG: radical SAM protein [Anaerolineae bacterium]